MDVNDLRSWVTVLSLLAFVGINVWVFSPRRKARFHEAAWLALQDENGGPDRAAHASGAGR